MLLGIFLVSAFQWRLAEKDKDGMLLKLLRKICHVLYPPRNDLSNMCGLAYPDQYRTATYLCLLSLVARNYGAFIFVSFSLVPALHVYSLTTLEEWPPHLSLFVSG